MMHRWVSAFAALALLTFPLQRASADLLAIGDAAQGLITSFHYSAEHPSALNDRFVKDYLAVSGQGIRPDFAAVAAYDTLAAIYKVAELQGGKVDPDRDPLENY